MDIACIEHVIKSTRKAAPAADGHDTAPVVFMLALPTASDMLDARKASTSRDESKPDAPEVFDRERFTLEYLGRVVRGVRGLVRDGQVVTMARDMALDGRIAWLKANLPMRWVGELVQAASNEEEIDAEEERSPSASPR